tara:strand:- start:6290 stop:6673 length:384 start_codon:yes stop_codon:yes gene_type:complete
MKKEIYEISSQYMKDLKKLLKNKKISQYDIAHQSFRKNNADWIIKHVNKAKLTITYLNGDVRVLPTYNELMRRVSWSNNDYKSARRRFIKRYYRIVNAFTKHKNRFKRNTIANKLNPQQIKQLASQI